MPKKNTQLRAYMYHQGEDFECSFLVFHYTARQAKSFAAKKGLGDIFFDYGEYTELKAVRRDYLDEFLRSDAKEPYVEEDDEILRDAGWTSAGNNICPYCSKGPIVYKDRIDYSLCKVCMFCTECIEKYGHEEGCANA